MQHNRDYAFVIEFRLDVTTISVLPSIGDCVVVVKPLRIIACDLGTASMMGRIGQYAEKIVGPS
ncbi:hypothetical protein DPMN_089495 [Dreissena polymorpha]|uniref:Uncharacterized protein n=1 Tax=Dreissena polymorpha TaxID=45954 RepID=A0A9D4KW29_DREPO|nr:hypothetical protein DPMN_089495 [Dreissena polymorpha]